MSIAYRKEEQKLILETENTSYRMTIERNGMLRHTYYGRKAGIGGRYSREGLYDRGFSGNPYEYRIERTVSYDTMLQEYTSCGVGDYRISSMEAENADGSRCADFRYVKHEIRKGKYCIRFTEDINRNSIVDTGSLLERRQPEKVRFFKIGGDIFLDLPEMTDLTQNASVREILSD